MFIAVCGVDSQLVADTNCNIAAVHKRRGKHEEAKYLECEATYAKVSGPDHSATTDAAGQVRNCDEESAAKAKEVTRNLEIERSRAASEATAGAGFRFTTLGHAGRKMINGRRPRARDGTRAGRGAFASLSSHIDSW